MTPTGTDTGAGGESPDRRLPRNGNLDRFAELRDQRGVHVAQLLERQPRWARDFSDLSYEWRRLFSEVFGTFLLVTVGVRRRGPAGVDPRWDRPGRLGRGAAPIGFGQCRSVVLPASADAASDRAVTWT